MAKKKVLKSLKKKRVKYNLGSTMRDRLARTYGNYEPAKPIDNPFKNNATTFDEYEPSVPIDNPFKNNETTN